MLKIGVITPIPTPYRDPFWNEVAAQPGVELDVYYCTDVMADRPWKADWATHFSWEVLSGTNLARVFGGKSSCWWNQAIRCRLQGGGYNALIISGYNHPTMLAAIWFAKRHRIPYFLMNESYLTQPRPWWRRVLKRPLVRWVVRGAAGCFPTGIRAREYVLHYGADPARVWFLPNVPDVKALDTQAKALATHRPRLRREFGFGDEALILFVGRLVSFKRVDLLLQAFASIVPRHPASLVIVGDGILRDDLETQASELGVAHCVRFIGFADPRDIPKWYATADLMVVPSTGETWSVALIEALASGLPVVTTDLVGASDDVLNHPEVGTVVPANNIEALADAIRPRITSVTNRIKLRELWTPIRDNLRYDVLARNIVEAIRETVSQLTTSATRSPQTKAAH